MGKHRAKEEKLKRIRLGSRYFGFDFGQFYWECLKLVATSEELTETDILRRIIRSWSEKLPSTIQEQAQAETMQVEAWKAQKLQAQKDAQLQARQTSLKARRAKSQEKRRRGLAGPALRDHEAISARH